MAGYFPEANRCRLQLHLYGPLGYTLYTSQWSSPLIKSATIPHSDTLGLHIIGWQTQWYHLLITFYGHVVECRRHLGAVADSPVQCPLHSILPMLFKFVNHCRSAYDSPQTIDLYDYKLQYILTCRTTSQQPATHRVEFSAVTALKLRAVALTWLAPLGRQVLWVTGQLEPGLGTNNV